jgi:hypothetical protein
MGRGTGLSLKRATATSTVRPRICLVKPPLFIWEPNDLMAFESAEALEAFVEPPDVDAGRAFDATGRLLSVKAEGTRTIVRDAEAVVSHQDELRSALVTALTAKEGESVRPASLEELVALAAARFTVPPPPSLATTIKRLIAGRRG